MRIDEIQVTVQKAAELSGWATNSLRAALRSEPTRPGLLKTTGMVPKLYAKEHPAEELDAKRWTWSRFGLRDICSFRLARCLLDAGLSFDSANGIASDENIWRHWRGADDHIAIEKWTPIFLIASHERPRARQAERPAPPPPVIESPTGEAREPEAGVDWCIYSAAELQQHLAALWGRSDHPLIFIPLHLIRWRVGQALTEIAGDEYGA